MENWNKFTGISLPSREGFYSILNNDKIVIEHILMQKLITNIWNMMKIVILDISSKSRLSLLNEWGSCTIICHFLKKKWSLQKTDKLVCNLNNKDSYVAHLKTFKEVVDHELKLEKVHRATKLNQQPLMNQQWLCEQCCVR